jgi:hypothetical protein
MATTAPSPKLVAMTIPADYVEDVRTAVIAEIEEDGNFLQTGQEQDRADTMRLLRNDVRLLDQLLDASGQTSVTSSSETLSEVLQAMVRLLSSRLVDACGYAPVDMAAVLNVARRLQWAAEEFPDLPFERDDSEAA